jgi:hypothetical protein
VWVQENLGTLGRRLHELLRVIGSPPTVGARTEAKLAYKPQPPPPDATISGGDGSGRGLVHAPRTWPGGQLTRRQRTSLRWHTVIVGERCSRGRLVTGGDIIWGEGLRGGDVKRGDSNEPHRRVTSRPQDIQREAAPKYKTGGTCLGRPTLVPGIGRHSILWASTRTSLPEWYATTLSTPSPLASS